LGAHPDEGPNRKCRLGTEDSMIEGVADARAEMPGRTAEAGGGTAGIVGCAQQTITASEEYVDDR